MKYIITASDFEELNNLAEDVITNLRFSRYQYDDNGNDAITGLSYDEVQKRIQFQIENEKNDYLNFKENDELKNISFYDAVYMPHQEVKEKYLKDILPIARGVMRKDPRMNHGAVVSDEVADDVLDNFLVLRWKENLKLWLVQLQKQGEKERE